MNRSLWLLALALLAVFSASLLQAETTIAVPASSLGTGEPGFNGTPFSFTTESDGAATVKALFLTHWLTPVTASVVANPKAVRFVVDGKSYPNPGAAEDFYGYVDRNLWPDRAARRDQVITVEEKIILPKGPHTIQFFNGLMERDDSRSVVVYSTADWASAAITINADGVRKGFPVVTLFPALLLQPDASIAPVIQSVSEGTSAIFTLLSSGTSRTDFTGNDGTAVANPASTVSVFPRTGDYTYKYLVWGKAQVRWIAIGEDKIWIDPPSGPSVDVTADLSYIATQSGDYVLRAVAGTETTSAPFHIDLPSAVATATLTVTKAPSTGGPVVTAFSPVDAHYTVTSGPAAGHSYARSWQADGAWAAYLGRDGVSFRVTGSSSAGPVANIEIQAQAPAGEWFTLVSGGPSGDMPNGPGISVSQTLSVRLGSIRADKPLLPADPSLVGTWKIRARLSDGTGAWSPWSFEQPLTVVYPVKDVALIGRTLPPVEDSAWFTASPEKQYLTQVLVP